MKAIFPVLLFLIITSCSKVDQKNSQLEGMVTIEDGLGRKVSFPENPERIICSGA